MHDDAEPLAGLRLYRVTACEHFVLECGRLTDARAWGYPTPAHPFQAQPAT